MMVEINIVRDFFINKFGSIENITDGVYAVPFSTSKGPAFMKAQIKDRELWGEGNFMLFIDEQLTESWYDKK